jgi:hypothetical protein
MPITKLIPTLRNQITADLSAAAYAAMDEDFERAIQLLDQVKRTLGLLEACIEEINQS